LPTAAGLDLIRKTTTGRLIARRLIFFAKSGPQP
jgi:hypothetical protein